MASLPWFRMYSEFAIDPKIQMLSEVTQRRYLMLLCLRCSNDTVTLHDDEVAFQLRISNEDYLETKSLLISKGLIDDDNKPTAWDKRQFTSDSSAARVARHRKNKKQACNVTETKSNAIDTESESESESESETESETDNKKINKKTATANEEFKKTTAQEIELYAKDKKINLIGFFDYYESNGWMVGKNKMKNWKAAASGWSNRNSQFGGTHENQPTSKILARRNSK